MVELLSYIRKMSQFFYAVGVGRQVGVYTSWPECQKQVADISNARYRKFKTHKEAVAFIQECKEKFSPYRIPSKVVTTRSNVASTQPNCSSWETGSDLVHSPVSSTQPINKGDRTKAFNSLTQPSKSLVQSAARTTASKQIEASSTSLESEKLSPHLQLAMAQLSDDDPFGDDGDLVNTSLQSSDTSVIKNFCKKVENYFVDLKTTLGHMMVKLHDLDTKVESLTNLYLDSGRRGNGEPASRSSVRRDLLASYDVPQPVGKRKKTSTVTAAAPASEVEEVPAPPRKIPKVEVNSDDEVDGFAYDFKVNEDGFVVVYTDGACEKNGRYGAKAGIGVWFGDSHPLNCSEPVEGRATNNNAEIQAAVQALEVAKRAGVKKVLIHTDSEFLINCVTKWVAKWKKNGWKAASGGPVKNKEELILLLESMKDLEVKWEHVRGHHGIHGNEMADCLARDGAKRYK